MSGGYERICRGDFDIEPGQFITLWPGGDITIFPGAMSEEDFYFLLVVSEYGWERAAAFERWRIRI